MTFRQRMHTQGFAAYPTPSSEALPFRRATTMRPPPPERPPSSLPPATPFERAQVAPESVASPFADTKPPPRDPEPAVTLATYAALTARIDLAPEHRAHWLREVGLDHDTWEVVDDRHARRLAAEIAAGDATGSRTFDEAYVAELEARRGVVDLAAYARLEQAACRGAVAAVLAELGLPRAALGRVRRVWTRRLLGDAELRRELRMLTREPG